MLTMTDSERRAGYVNVMGTSLGNLYHDLENEVALLVRKWDEFDELFNDDEGQLALLNLVDATRFRRHRRIGPE